MPPSLAALRHAIDPQQASLLGAVWLHRISTGDWIPVRLLHSLPGGKPQIRPQLAALGGGVVYEADDVGTPRYGLTLLGALLSDDGVRLERLLTRYLTLARDLALKEPLRTHVHGSEAASNMSLTPPELIELGELIRLSPFHHGGGFGRDE